MRHLGRCRSAATVVLIVTLGACATAGGFRKKMNTWVGHDVSALITTWGPPGQTFDVPNGSKVYSWLWVGNTVVTTNYYSYLNMVQSGAVTYWCKINVTAGRGNVISTWSAQGNACKSR